MTTIASDKSRVQGRHTVDASPANDGELDYQPVEHVVQNDGKHRRKYDRSATEANLLAAALRLLERDGVLAGLNLQEVANEAGVNRGQIYQYFGSREGLLRAALSSLTWDRHKVFSRDRDLPFAERRLRVFAAALENITFIRLEALLAITHAEELRLFPMLETTKGDLARDQESGHLPAGADAVVMHLMTAATYLGYAVFRDAMAREAGIALQDLDRRALAVFAKMVKGLVSEE